MVYESSLDDFCVISYYVLGIKSFCNFIGRGLIGLHLMEKNAFLVSAYLHYDSICILSY